MPTLQRGVIIDDEARQVASVAYEFAHDTETSRKSTSRARRIHGLTW